MYAEKNENMLIGECLLDLKTSVTPNEAQEGLYKTPSAAMTVGAILGVGAVGALMSLYCYCCCASRKRTAARVHVDRQPRPQSEFKKMEAPETDFKRMEDVAPKTEIPVGSDTVKQQRNRAKTPEVEKGCVPLM